MLAHLLAARYAPGVKTRPSLALRRRLARRLAPTLALLTLAACAAQAAPPPEPARPRIGLALSGGGARGFAHVGVLRVLESLHVPVDCIAGTSAGAAVGAAYAMGLTPDEIEQRLRSADWNGDMFDDSPDRAELPYRAKSPSRSVPIGVTLGVGPDGLKGPTGVVAGQKVELFLHRMLGTSVEFDDFDRLPLPFRAVATDLVSGEMVAQRQGSLVRAVRASMAVPSAFAPVSQDGKMLVDGGLSQNLPVGVVRQTCAPDAVIAVNIGSPLLQPEELGSLFGVALQVVSILMERNVAESIASLGPRDVLITPEIEGITAVDFARGVQGIPAGEAAARAAAGQLQGLALEARAYAAWQTERQSRRVAPRAVDRVRVAELRFVNPRVFAIPEQELVPPRVPDIDTLQQRIRRWSASGDFTQIGYSVRREGEGWTLWLDPREKPWGPDYLQVGFAGSSDTNANAEFSVQAALRRTWLNRWGAEWLTVAQFGRERGIFTEWFQPLGVGSRWYLMPRAGTGSRPLRVFSGKEAVAEYTLRRSEVELALGLQGRLGDARLGLVNAHLRAYPRHGQFEIGSRSNNISGLRVAFDVDTLDSVDFPRRGYAASLNAFAAQGDAGASTRYRRHDYELLTVHSQGAHTWRARLHGGRVLSEGAGLSDAVSAGGFLNLSGYQPGQFLGSEIAVAQLGYYLQMAPLPRPFGSGLYAGVSLEGARIRQPLGSSEARLDRFGLALYVGAATGLGPAYLGLGLGQDGNRAIYLFLGRP